MDELKYAGMAELVALRPPPVADKGSKSAVQNKECREPAPRAKRDDYILYGETRAYHIAICVNNLYTQVWRNWQTRTVQVTPRLCKIKS